MRRVKWHLQRLLSVVMVGATVSLAPIGHCYALDIGLSASANLNATFGLDQSTQNFINGLPKVVHDELIKTLQEALPLIDTSVMSYLDKVDDIVNRQLNHMECVLQGSGAGVGSEFKKALFGGVPKPVTTLDSEIQKMQKGIHAGDDPHKLVLSYSDLLYDAVVTGCQVGISPSSASTVDKMSADVRARWAIWNRLDGQCKNSSDCYDQLSAQVVSDLAAADKRDIDVVDGSGRFGKLQKPKPPGFFGSFAAKPFEDNMIVMASIHDGIAFAKFIREAQGDKAMADATASVGAAQAQIVGVPANFDKRNCSDALNARNRGAAAAASLASVLTVAAQAVVLKPQLDPQKGPLMNQYQALQAQSAQIMVRVHAAYFQIITPFGKLASIPCGL